MHSRTSSAPPTKPPHGAFATVRELIGRRATQNAAFGVGLAALLAFSFAWVWIVGHRGLFMLDESIVFDGAWRIAQGQVPYRDFVMPFGPITFALQGWMFRMAGVSFSSLVLTAAILSMLTCAVVVRLLWVLTDGSRIPTLLGALLTAVWFQAPFGIPWMEQTGFAFDLLAVLAVVEGRLGAHRAGAWYVLAGLASTAAILSKQNAGGLFVPVCIGCLCLPWRARARDALRGMALYAAGGLFGSLIFLAWLRTFSDVAAFRHYWLELSAAIGLGRFAYWKILGMLVFQSLTSSAVPLFLVSTTVGGVTLLVLLLGRAETPPTARAALCGWLAVALPQFHSAFQLTTNNDASNNNAFVGICVACTLALVGRWIGNDVQLEFRSGRQSVHIASVGRLVAALAVVVSGLAVYSLADGLIIAHGRFVHEFPAGVRFDDRVAIPAASRLVWGEPTRITPQVCPLIWDACSLSGPHGGADHDFEILRRRDFERIATELQRRDRNFFVFPDATILYGLTGRPSPQPVLYFHPGQSFAVDDEHELDLRIVDSLRKNHVTLVVLERASFMGTQRLLSRFPTLDAWIRDRFRTVEEFGNYRLLEARDGSSSPRAATD